MEFWATLAWQGPNDVPRDSLIPIFPETVKSSLTDSTGADGTSRVVTGELRALCEGDLGAALDLLLRAITSKAALTDAVLETRAVRLASPRAAQASLVCEMARELWEAGHRVTFGPSWEAVPDVDLALGAGGSNGDLESVFREKNSWKLTPRQP